MYIPDEHFMVANGVSFSAQEIMRHLRANAAETGAPEPTREDLEAELVKCRKASVLENDTYARDELGINTGNVNCS